MSLREAISADYHLYRRWFERSLDVIWGLPPELRAKADPMREIERAESKSISSAIKMLSSGIEDTISITERNSIGQLSIIDIKLQSDGLPSLSFIKNLFSKEIKKILKLKFIESEEDYFSLKNLEDCDPPEKVKMLIRELCGSYELRTRQGVV
ncbi:hypothetical protein [Nitrospirillum amazonense]|uniref:hypothetical protein n=1 Tax=Nitrospirillum amazonense TaxID=28077 RepID=UPI0024126C2B|nr:hypothetical protein [Nitrospirillum amazonense]MDG3443153.1 hypothetical protein [Nitrospirillum amazonense]